MSAFDFAPVYIEKDRMIMLKLPSGNFKVITTTPNTTVSLGKFGVFNTNEIIGKPFGYTFEINNDKTVKVVEQQFELDGDGVDEMGDDENNREVVNDQDNQTLTMKEIENLKKTAEGRDIVTKMMESHVAFDKKTTFSQEKYLARKKQKYLKQFSAEHISINELVEIYLDKDANRIQDISVETLSFILSIANIQPGGKYLVVDEASGLLVASLLERIGDEGLVVIAHESEHPNLDALRYMNYPKSYLDKMVKTINLLDFVHPEESELASFQELDDSQLGEFKANQKAKYYRRKQLASDFQICRDLIDNSGFDALVVISSMQLESLVPALIDSVSGSRNIVVYSGAKENIVPIAHELHRDLRVLAPTMMELRARKYQTLPGRVHPHMSARGGGGYVVYGTRVYPGHNVNAKGVDKRKKRKKDDSERDDTPGIELAGTSETVESGATTSDNVIVSKLEHVDS